MSDLFSDIAPEKRETALKLDRLFQDATGWRPKLWGKLIGYGQYHYRYDSGREGDSLATGFNLRARDISLHILPGYCDFPEIAARLGPHTRGRSCWYIKSIENIDEIALADLIRARVDDLKSTYEVIGT